MSHSWREASVFFGCSATAPFGTYHGLVGIPTNTDWRGVRPSLLSFGLGLFRSRHEKTEIIARHRQSSERHATCSIPSGMSGLKVETGVILQAETHLQVPPRTRARRAPLGRTANPLATTRVQSNATRAVFMVGAATATIVSAGTVAIRYDGCDGWRRRWTRRMKSQIQDCRYFQTCVALWDLQV